MEKNFYDILEININASQEIIDKAYKVLVKKYHPDLQNSAEEKAKCEAKIKEINEAFDTLSNPQKREEYDKFILESQISEEDYNDLYNENENLKREINTLKNNSNANINNSYNNQNPKKDFNNQNSKKDFNSQNADFEKEYENAINKAYHDAYIQDLKNRGYKIKYKKTFSDYIRSFIALLITLIILFLVFQIPFVKNYFISLYNENALIKNIVDFFVNIFN